MPWEIQRTESSTNASDACVVIIRKLINRPRHFTKEYFEVNFKTSGNTAAELKMYIFLSAHENYSKVEFRSPIRDQRDLQDYLYLKKNYLSGFVRIWFVRILSSKRLQRMERHEHCSKLSWDCSKLRSFERNVIKLLGLLIKTFY